MVSLHRFSRTQALLTEVFPVFQAADAVWVSEIYGAGEPPIPGLTGRLILEGIHRAGHPAAHFAPDRAALTEALLAHLRPGDVLVTMGAGDIWRLGEDLLAHLGTQSSTFLSPAAKGEESCRGARP